jgi:serine protease Do
LKTKGSVSRGYLGIGVGEFSDEIAEQIGVPKGTRGVLVAEVFKGQSAEKAGILPYDVITRVNGDKITNPLDLTTRITAIPVGGIAEITLYRKGKEKTLALKVGERPSPIAGRADWNSNKKSNKTATFNEMKEWGFRAEDLNPELAKSLGIPFSDSKASPSVVVTDLDFGKPAAESGLLRGDVVLDLGGKTIQNVNQLEETLKGTKGKSLLIRVRRYGPQGETTVVILLKPS